MPIGWLTLNDNFSSYLGESHENKCPVHIFKQKHQSINQLNQTDNDSQSINQLNQNTQF